MLVTFISHSQLAVSLLRRGLNAGVCEPSPEVRRERRAVYRPPRTRKYRRPERSSARRQPARSYFLLPLPLPSSPPPLHGRTEAPAKTPSRLSGNYAPLPSSARPAEWRTYTAGFSPLHHLLPSPFLSHSLVSTMPPPTLSLSPRPTDCFPLASTACLSSCLEMKELINLI